MAVKKKTAKKTVSKKSASKKSQGQPISNGVAKKSTKKSARSAQKIDEILVKFSPALQNKVNQLVGVLENSREGRLGDLTFLASKILLRAQEVSKGLKALRKKSGK